MSKPKVTYSVKPAPVPGKVCVSQTTTHDEKLSHSTTMLMPPKEVPALFAALVPHVDLAWRLAAVGLSEATTAQLAHVATCRHANAEHCMAVLGHLFARDLDALRSKEGGLT